MYANHQNCFRKSSAICSLINRSIGNVVGLDVCSGQHGTLSITHFPLEHRPGGVFSLVL